ncbi:MAG TPA: 50S ribosomal protein L1 [Bacteroidetes bacterium]|nr:50S ribosomal protein L1 [bacterium BMS3Bbin04]HDO66124.1 50S ribosomal protein L1 [Bacteroidota bacterium]HEX05249.1 50S ribosomal protein L1 [Bacteroidota bacterium]
MKRSRRWKEAMADVDRLREYQLVEGIDLVKKFAQKTKFDETVELTVNLDVDPRKADQMIRGTLSLPHGTGKVVRVLVLTKGEKQVEAREAGADYVGFDEYIDKISNEGWFEFDVLVATPDVMRDVGKLGRALGPRGLMPNPKTGTVTFDVGKAVEEVKAGRIDFRVDKYGIVHVGVGKGSFEANMLEDNVREVMTTINRMRPAAVKGVYIKRVSLSSTMSPGVRLQLASSLSAEVAT